ncbi:unnamed protein product [Leptidea sinapis]|uniref:Trichohyalin-plectin-homology domain-containing protein n=1 Tax=Leptidea sinapis TaxID=189913 RepID=A0A5E4PV30_9NEOP|nr:unnamed protein product [Leptidea sinapis]
MMKLQICNDQDRKEAQNRERRRQCELERRSRIFNARNRKIGVDVPFLERQIAEKRSERDEQERKDLAFAKQMIKDSNLAVVLEGREMELLLNRFEGEDLEYEERKKIMAQQKNAWLEQQVQERKSAQEERKKAEAAYMMAIRARDARAGELDKMERECRYRLGQANLRYNEALAAEKKQLESIMREQEEADNTAEMYNNLTSDMLTENPDVAKSALGKNRKSVKWNRRWMRNGRPCPSPFRGRWLAKTLRMGNGASTDGGESTSGAPAEGEREIFQRGRLQ